MLYFITINPLPATLVVLASLVLYLYGSGKSSKKASADHLQAPSDVKELRWFRIGDTLTSKLDDNTGRSYATIERSNAYLFPYELFIWSSKEKRHKLLERFQAREQAIKAANKQFMNAFKSTANGNQIFDAKADSASGRI